MLNDTEFAALVHIPAEAVASITPEVEPFTLFSLETVVEKPNGKKIKLNLWNVQRTSRPSLQRLVAQDQERERSANLARYINQGFAFESPDGASDDESEE